MNELVPIDLRDGKYYGVWGGHDLRFIHDRDLVCKETKLGVRGFNIPVSLTVENGEVDENTIKTLREWQCSPNTYP